MADDKTVLLHALTIHSWALRSWRSLQFAIWCTLGVQLAMIVLIPMRKVLDIQEHVYMYVCASIAAFVIGGALGLLMPLSHYLVATVIDAKFQLKERVQSALEFLQRDDLALTKPLIRDAIQSLERTRSQESKLGVKECAWQSLVAGVLIAASLLTLPPIPAALFSKRSMLETSGTQTVPEPAVKLAKSQGSNDDEGSEPTPLSGQTVAAKATFKDSTISSEPPDFVSFVKSGDDRLKLLDPGRNASTAGPRPKPVKLAPQRQGQGGESSFEPASFSAEEATERMSKLEKIMKQSGAAAQEREKDQAKGEKIPGGHPSDTQPTSPAPDASSQASAGKSRSQDEAKTGEKGLAKKSATPAEDSQGTPSSDQVETPNRSPAKQKYDQDMQAARFGGGQYPHNAPGAGFPDWMRGNQDPHFMDAGQGEGPSTGKTSGQAGVGHALLNEGLESQTLKLPSIRNLYLPGQLQDGEQSSYETDMLSPGAESSLNVPYSNVLTQYEFQAEEQMSRNHVPFAFRTQVQAYFSRIR
jgi:hypothetical protein